MVEVFVIFRFHLISTAKSSRLANIFFLLINDMSGFLAGNNRPVCILSSQEISCILYSRMDFCLRIYHIVVWSNLNILNNSMWDTFRTQSCLVWYSFLSGFQHSFIMWLTVSSLPPHNQHFPFCCVLSILALNNPYGSVMHCY